MLGASDSKKKLSVKIKVVLGYYMYVTYTTLILLYLTLRDGKH